MKILEPDKVQRNKHQINALAYDYMKDEEGYEEIKDINKQGKLKTKEKYGW